MKFPNRTHLFFYFLFFSFFSFKPLITQAAGLKTPLKSKIIFMVSTPRSLSTGIMNSMLINYDISVFNEPFQKAFMYGLKDEKSITYANKVFPKGVKSYQDFLEILGKEEKNPNHRGVFFIKELSYAFEDFMLNNLSFFEMNKQNISVVYLLRSPHETIISYTKKVQGIDKTDIDFATAEQIIRYLGFKELKNSYDFLISLGLKPLVLDTTALLTLKKSPAESIFDFCGLASVVDPLNEPLSLSESEILERWHECKGLKAAKHWHSTAMGCLEISRVNQSSYDLNDEGKPNFNEIKDQNLLQVLKSHYEKVALPVYTELKGFSI